jgi:hypothetical protein
MRKLVMVAVVSLAVAGGVASTADSAVHWPARCHTFRWATGSLPTSRDLLGSLVSQSLARR